MFEIGLQKNRSLDNFSLEAYLDERDRDGEPGNQELDSVQAVTMEICGRLHDLKVVEFVVRGFGQYPWAVDVWYDLSMMLEEVPALFECIDNNGPDAFTLNYAAQGTERSLIFTIEGDRVEIICESRTDWQPDPRVEISDLKTLDEMFSRLLLTLVSETGRYFPDLIENRYFKEWRRLPPLKKRLENLARTEDYL